MTFQWHPIFLLWIRVSGLNPIDQVGDAGKCLCVILMGDVPLGAFCVARNLNGEGGFAFAIGDAVAEAFEGAACPCAACALAWHIHIEAGLGMGAEGAEGFVPLDVFVGKGLC